MMRSRLRSRFETLPAWLPAAVLVLIVIFISFLFLMPSYVEFPMDDTYIHFIYANNLSESGRLIFSFENEKGVGSTSILWVLLLAVGNKAGISMHLLAKLLGVASLAALSVVAYKLLCPIMQPHQAFLASLLVAVSGNMLWFALSGMETMLFLALGVLALLVYRHERWYWLGIVLGLLILTRPEGMALAISLGCIELWRQKRFHHGILISGILCLLICGPWFGYIYWRTGYILPTSAIGKKLTFSIGTSVILERSDALAVLGRYPALIYVGLWVVYLLEFALGGIALPSPHIAIGGAVGNLYYTTSIWAFIGWIGVVIPLLTAAFRRGCVFRFWPRWLSDQVRSPLIVLLIWTILHNLCYIIFMPVPGTASRYGALNHFVLWLVLAFGLFSIKNRPRLRTWLGGGLAMIALVNMLYWNSVYDSNLYHMNNVRIKAAHYIRDHFSLNERCAAFDVGAIRYHSERPIIDIGALVDIDAGHWFQEGASDQYLIEKEVTCLVLPGRSGSTTEGWFDLADIMGLTSTPLFDLQPVKVFEIDYERWLQGYLPTNNYQASVNIYRLVTHPSEIEK